MKTFMMILTTVMMATPAFARTGFVYESLTQTGAKYILVKPMWSDGKTKSVIEQSVGDDGYASDTALGIAVCRAFGFKSGIASVANFDNSASVIQLAYDGSIYNVVASTFRKAVFSAVCSYASVPSSTDSPYPPSL